MGFLLNFAPLLLGVKAFPLLVLLVLLVLLLLDSLWSIFRWVFLVQDWFFYFPLEFLDVFWSLSAAVLLWFWVCSRVIWWSGLIFLFLMISGGARKLRGRRISRCLSRFSRWACITRGRGRSPSSRRGWSKARSCWLWWSACLSFLRSCSWTSSVHLTWHSLQQ